jgi:filamentous hemagglutinin family protein
MMKKKFCKPQSGEKLFDQDNRNLASQFRKLPICLALSCIFSSSVHALPQTPVIGFGTVNITSSSNVMEINQAGNKAVINWQQFGVGAGETVKFNQPSNAAITLNRVLGTDSSTINGTLTANGRVFIINPNGVLFGESAQLNVGGIVASTMGLSDADFLSSNYNFYKESNATRSVTNSGSITAVEGGYVVMLSDQVRNAGSIDAPLGSVLMGAGAEATLYFSKNALVGYAIPKETAAALVENAKNIKAHGGMIALVANGLSSLDQAQRAVVNNTGIIEAQALKNKAGKIELSADMHGGRVSMSGTLDASGMDYQGGEITTSAATVNIDPVAVITTNSSVGKTGTWTVNAGNAAIGGNLDNISDQALNQALKSNNVVINAVGTGVAGTGNLEVNKQISSSGTNKISLKATGDISINAPISVDAGGIVVYADTPGAGVGRIKFSEVGKISANNNGTVDLYTNVAQYTDNAIYDGFITSPYSLWMLVNNADQLQKINTNLSGKYAIGRDIDAGDTRKWHNGEGFIPLGASFSSPFVGKLDGMNRTISNLYINRPTTDYVGLFSISQGDIKNLGLINAYVRGSDTVGTFIGSNAGGMLSNVYATGYVRAEGDPKIMSSDRPLHTGGLVGVNGMALKNLFTFVTGQITDAYSDVTVSGNSGLGGIVGTNYGFVDRVYAVGKIELTGDTTSSVSGGIAGINSYGSSISNAYWATDSTSQSAIVGLNQGRIDNASLGRQVTYNDLKKIPLEASFSENWYRYDGYTLPLLKSFLKPLSIFSLDQDINKIYDGKVISSSEKYYFSENNAPFSGNLQSTPFKSFESGADVGFYSNNSARNFWSNQQGYLMDHPVLDDIVTAQINHRPIVVAAIPDSREYDGSSNSNSVPQLSGSVSSGNYGLAIGDTMTAHQEFDSSETGSRTLQVKNVDIFNKDGKKVTSNYMIAKVDTLGVILQKTVLEPPHENPDGGSGNPVRDGGNSANPGSNGSNGSNNGNQGNNGNSGNQASNAGNSSGASPGVPDQASNTTNRNTPLPNDPSSNIGVISGKPGTGNNLDQDFSLGLSPIERFNRSRNSLAWQNVDDEESQRLRQIRRIGRTKAVLTLKDDGIEAPAN